MALEDRAVGLLRQLIRHRTVNPPGDERALQEKLAAEFTQAGFEVSLLGATPVAAGGHGGKGALHRPLRSPMVCRTGTEVVHTDPVCYRTVYPFVALTPLSSCIVVSRRRKVNAWR